MKQRYFVLHLSASEMGTNDYPEIDKPYSIQILDNEGKGIESGVVGESDGTLIIGRHVVPKAVIDAARRQPLGKGDYIDENGRRIVPFEYPEI